MKAIKRELHDRRRLYKKEAQLEKCFIEYCKKADKAGDCGMLNEFLVSLDSKDPLRPLQKRGERLALIRYAIEISEYPKLPRITKELKVPKDVWESYLKALKRKSKKTD